MVISVNRVNTKHRYDIVEAYYWFFVDYHDGQWSNRYKRLSKITTYFKPNRYSRGPSSEEAWKIYRRLEEIEIGE